MKKLLVILFMLIATNIWAVPATMYVTSAGGGDKSGSSWANAMGEAEFETDIEGGAEAGDIYYVAGGTYTLDSAYSTAKFGSATAPIQIIGVKSGTTNAPPSFSDWAFGTDRPLFANGGWGFSITNTYWNVYNLRFTCTYDFGVYFGGYSTIYNCKITNSSANSSFGFVANGSYVKMISCESIDTNGSAFYAPEFSDFINCYAHDSTKGFYINTSYVSVTNSIIDTCTTAFDIDGTVKYTFINNTLYNCTTGYDIGGTTSGIFTNNIIANSTTGATATANNISNFWNYNCWSSNTTDVSNVTKGNNDITASALLNDPANGDFTLRAGSPCLDAGMQPDANIGVVGDYKWNIGADQDNPKTLSSSSVN